MKCDNCGNVYKNNLKCPLCGHHQAKIYHCSVCDTVIHFGQSHCPKCGSPTRYNKQEDISKKYSSKFISTDYSKHSRSTHVYKQQEMYDYKSSDNEIKQRLEEARKKILNYRAKSVKSKVSLEKRNLLKLVIGGFVILSVAFSFFTTERLDIEIVELDRIEVNGNNNDLMMAGNFQHGGLVYQNSDDIYLGVNYQLNKTDSSFSGFYNMTPESDGNVYVEGNYIYYSSFESYRRYDINAEEEIGLFNVEKVLPIKNHRFLYTDGTGLYLYENEESKQLADYNTSVFTFDFKNELVYFEKDGVIRSVDLRGMFINDYNICVFNNLYVDDGVIYYYDFDGVKSYATDTNNIWLYVEDDDIYNFIVTDQGVVYTNTDNELYYYYNDGGEVYFIGDDVLNFNVIGDKVIYCDNEGYSWFISDGYELVSEFLE
ncbi:hypothetical protein [Thomasclavelia cocleata]|uniref:hypothetical protein n=1 Tax=Thomasclavelia cocleata TaxID=69824 RepID=UPI0025582351|nr:hypothetical protein [Thomasclavelia cocleata]